MIKYLESKHDSVFGQINKIVIPNIGNDTDTYKDAWIAYVRDPNECKHTYLKNNLSNVHLIEILDIYVPNSVRHKKYGTKLIKQMMKNMPKKYIIIALPGYTLDELNYVQNDEDDIDLNKELDYINNISKFFKTCKFKKLNIPDSSDYKGYMYRGTHKTEDLFDYIVRMQCLYL